ncbi:MAG: hypothetical protein V5B33_14220 [Candidatus Accumulibacter sp. UW20]|jgi:hypothetical protein
MTTKEKAMARTMAVSKTTSTSRHSTPALPYWLANISTMAAGFANLAAPMAAMLAGRLL